MQFLLCQKQQKQWRRIFTRLRIAIYATDFGRIQIPQLDGDCTSYLREFVAHSLEWAIGRRHWDLVAEVVLSMQCLRLHGRQWRNGWLELAKAQDLCGALPEANLYSKLITEEACRKPNEFEFLTLYHRSLALALAAFGTQ
jgi:hypothetical protein